MVYYFTNYSFISNFLSNFSTLNLIPKDFIVKIVNTGQSTNLYLMKKLDMNKDEVNHEFDDFIKGEVTKRVDKKIKTFKRI